MRMHLQVIEDRARKFLKDNISKLSDKQLWLRVKKMWDALLPAEEPELLLQALLKTMSSNSVQLVLLERAGVVPEPSLLGREQQAVRAAQTLAEDFVTRRRGGEEYTKVSLDHAILTIKAVGLSSKQRGDAAILATAIRCDKKFAMKLLHEVDSGTEVSLYKRSLREGAIKGTEYPKLLPQFSWSLKTAVYTLARSRCLWVEIYQRCQRGCSAGVGSKLWMNFCRSILTVASTGVS